MASPRISDEEILESIKSSWAEWKAPHWRAWHTSDSSNAAKRCWAVALGSTWKGTGEQKMRHLLKLLPLAIEQAAKHPAFASARTTIWTVLRESKGMDRLAGGVYGETDRDRIRLYSEQVLRLRLPEETILLVNAVARAREITPSTLVTEIIEDAMQKIDYPPAAALS